MLSTASRRAPSARALHSRRASIACATCQQRAFRFGPWSDSSAETEITKSQRRRNNRRGFRYRYMESVKSQQWDGEGKAAEADPLLVKATEILKERMESSPKSPKGAHYINIEKDLNPDTAPGTRPGRNIEDVERDAINHLFTSHSDHAKTHYDLWRKPLSNIRMLHAEQAPKQATPDEVIHATATAAESDEGQIDPITNRRTPMQRAGESSTFTPKFEDVDQQPNLQAKEKENYEKVQWNEPEGLPRKTREEESKQYDDLNKYRPERWNEPNGLPRETPEELSKNFTDLDQYGQVKWNEPDGLQKATSEEESKVYDDLSNYTEPRTAPDSVVKEYEAIQMDSTVKGNVLPSKVEVAAEEPGKEYTDLGEYKAVYWNEPDGLRKPTPEELSQDYDDLHLYGQVKWNEPNGLPKAALDSMPKRYADLPLHDLGSPDPESHSVRKHPEQPFRDYDDLGNYGTPVIGRVDAPYHVHPEEQSKKYSDLDRYDPQNFDSPAPAEASMSREAFNSFNDLGSYTQRSQPQGISSPGASGVSSGSDGQDGEDGSKLDNLTPDEIRANVLRRVRKQTPSMEQDRQEMATKYREEWDPAVKEAQADLDKKHPRKLTGNYARDFPEEFTTSWSTTNSPSHTTLFPKDKAERTMQYQNEWRGEVEPSSMDESFPSEGSRLEPALNRHARRGSSATFMEGETQHAEFEAWFERMIELAERDLEAQYPTQAPPAPDAKPASLDSARSESTFQEAIQETEEQVAAQNSSQSSPDPIARQASSEDLISDVNFQAAVEKAEQQLAAQHSTPQSAPEAVERGSARETRQASEARFDEAVREAEEKLQAQQSTSAKTSTTYKILAYDPTTDLIRTAETSSSVQDISVPLTPANVIPKLSNPSKFFAHFSGLQSQGYEIVSGERDVLVFRKISPSPTPKPKFEAPSRVNPIDMMGKPPITGNFASPTGFVNYDSVEEPNHKPEPPFRSNIDVRREEPVYSGPKEADVGKEKKKRGLGKRVIIGTAYVAGGVYAIGVIRDYFFPTWAPPRRGVEPIARRL